MTTATATTDRFPGHQPGEPYELTREEFIRFAGLETLYIAFLAVLPHHSRCSNRHEIAQQAFWAAIAVFESRRQFDDDNRCESQLYADEADDDGDGAISWFYRSTSGTEFYAVDWRSGDGEPVFTVEIPADRDQPGRYHYEQLRQGGTYCD